jgi:hypothetical protein
MNVIGHLASALLSNEKRWSLIFVHTHKGYEGRGVISGQ